jgi:hypothetical protein
MDHPLYDIYSTGQLVEGIDTVSAKANLASLFKTTEESVAKVFNGKPQSLKRGVDKAEALRYKATLHKAGILVAVKAHQATHSSKQDQTTTSQTVQTTVNPLPNQLTNTEEKKWSLAPTGSDVLRDNERHSIPARDIDTSNIKMVSAFIDPLPEEKATPPTPDTRHISVAVAGEDLLVDKPQTAPSLPLDLDGITLTPLGMEPNNPQEKLAYLGPDTSDMSIAEVGADILENKSKQVPSPPNTDHISVTKNI